MLKYACMTGAAAAVAVLAVGSVGPAVGTHGGGHDDHEKVIRVLSKPSEEKFVDLDGRGPTLGDMFVFRSELTMKGKRVGHTGVVCTVTSKKHEEVQCLGTARFGHRGQITVQGLIAGSPRAFRLAINGGTGAFEGAEGTLFVKELSGDRERLTFAVKR